MTKNALNSLYGEGHAQATLNKTRARECVAMPGVRNQVILTSQPIIDGLLEFWPKGIAYDAAGAPNSLVGAKVSTELRGLLDPWPDRTYCNCPYGKSLEDPAKDGELWAHEQTIREAHREINRERKERDEKPLPLRFPKDSGMPVPTVGLDNWLQMQLTQSLGESIMLVPNRTHRPWLRRWRQKISALIELNPITFVGFPQAYPAPLVLGLFISPYNYVAQKQPSRVEDFHKAFAHVGDPA